MPKLECYFPDDKWAAGLVLLDRDPPETNLHQAAREMIHHTSQPHIIRHGHGHASYQPNSIYLFCWSFCFHPMLRRIFSVSPMSTSCWIFFSCFVRFDLFTACLACYNHLLFYVNSRATTHRALPARTCHTAHGTPYVTGRGQHGIMRVWWLLLKRTRFVTVATFSPLTYYGWMDGWMTGEAVEWIMAHKGMEMKNVPKKYEQNTLLKWIILRVNC